MISVIFLFSMLVWKLDFRKRTYFLKIINVFKVYGWLEARPVKMIIVWIVTFTFPLALCLVEAFCSKRRTGLWIKLLCLCVYVLFYELLCLSVINRFEIKSMCPVCRYVSMSKKRRRFFCFITVLKLLLCFCLCIK